MNEQVTIAAVPDKAQNHSPARILAVYYCRFFQVLLIVLLAWLPFAVWLLFEVYDSLISLGLIADIFYAFKEALQFLSYIRWICFVLSIISLSWYLKIRFGWRKLPHGIGLPVVLPLFAAIILDALFESRFSLWASLVVWSIVLLCIYLLVKIEMRLVAGSKKMDAAADAKKDGAIKALFHDLGKGGLALVALAGIGWTIAAVRAPLGNDEIFNYVNYSQLGPLISLVRYDFPNNHLLYSIINSILVWPNSPIGMVRIVPVVSAIVVSLLVFTLVNRSFGRRAALAALVVTCLSPVFLSLASHGRGYLPAMALSLAGLFFLTRSTDQQMTEVVDNRSYAAGVFCLTLSVMTIPAFGILFAVAWAVTIWMVKQDRAGQLRTWLVGVLGGMIFLIPAIVFLVVFWPNTYFAGYTESATSIWVSLKAALENLAPLLHGGVGQGLNTLAYIGLGLGSIILILGGIYAGFKQEDGPARWLTIIGVFAAMGTVVICLLFTGEPARRQVVQFVPLLIILFAVGLAYIIGFLGRRWLVVLLALYISAVPFLLSRPFSRAEPDPDIAEVAQVLNQQGERLGLMVSHSPYTMAVFPGLDINMRHHVFDSGFVRFANHPFGPTLWYLTDSEPGRPTFDDLVSDRMSESYQLEEEIKLNGRLRLFRYKHIR